MLSLLDVNMSCRLHLHAIMKCAYIHNDVIDHTLHRVWDYGLTPLVYQGCNHTPRPSKEAVKMGSNSWVRSTQTRNE